MKSTMVESLDFHFVERLRLLTSLRWSRLASMVDLSDQYFFIICSRS